MSVASLRNGDRFTVSKVILARETGKRLADMGFTEGADGVVVGRALFGDPIHVRIRGYDLVLRRREALGVLVNPLPEMADSVK